MKHKKRKGGKLLKWLLCGFLFWLTFSGCYHGLRAKTTLDIYAEMETVRERLADSWLLFPAEIQMDHPDSTLDSIDRRAVAQHKIDSLFKSGLKQTRPHQQVNDFKSISLTFPNKMTDQWRNQKGMQKMNDSLLRELSPYVSERILLIPVVTSLRVPLQSGNPGKMIEIRFMMWDMQNQKRLAVVKTQSVQAGKQSLFDRITSQKEVDTIDQLVTQTWKALPLSITDRFIGKSFSN